MDEQNEQIDHIPIVNSFLTMLPEEQQATIRKESPKQIIKSVHDWFDAQAKMLHAKKQKEMMKQKRIKQLQIQFQMQRVKKQRQIQQKLANIEKNKNKNIHYIQQKLRKVSIRHNKTIVKIQDENIKQMQKQFDSRKAYQFDNSRRSSKLTHTSHQSSPQNKLRISKQYNTKTSQQQDVQHRMNEIDNRLQKAKTMYRQRRSETVNKARNHNLYDLYHVQVKAKEKFNDYLLNNTTKIMSKMESAEFNKDKVDKQIQKKNKERHKSYSEKLKKIQINLNQLQEQQQLKFQTLSKKLQQTLSREKGSQERRQTVYHKKFLNNLQKIEKNKVERANRIIQKHKQISLKNRLFKQKRQSLYKTVKVSPQ